MVAGKYTTYDYKNLTWAPHSLYWRQGLKIYLSHLFSLKVLDSIEYILPGKPTMLKEHLSRLTLSIVNRIVLGKKYFSMSKSETSIASLEVFQEMLEELFFINGVLNIGDWIPRAQCLDLQGYIEHMKALKKKFNRFHDHVLDEQKANMK
ncbi:hypothetical protein TB2_017705 [Malus domestica]